MMMSFCLAGGGCAILYLSPIEKSCNWSKVEQHHIDKYRHLISADLPSLPPDLA